ncbi:hypothetical protein ACWC9T_32390 [Kitasatospora sp. NPDC001159]
MTHQGARQRPVAVDLQLAVAAEPLLQPVEDIAAFRVGEPIRRPG